MIACRTMVCVTGQKTCERLIHEGLRFVVGLPHGLSVVHVAHTGDTFLGSPKDSEALEYLYRISRDNGADMTVLRADNVLGTLVDYAQKHRIECIVLGTAGDQSSMDFAQELRMRLPNVTIHVVMPE